EALVEGLLWPGLVVAAVIDEFARPFRAHTQLQPAARACEKGVVLAQFPGPLGRDGPYLRHELVDALDAGFDLDISRHAPASGSPHAVGRIWDRSIAEPPCDHGVAAVGNVPKYAFDPHARNACEHAQPCACPGHCREG